MDDSTPVVFPDLGVSDQGDSFQKGGDRVFLGRAFVRGSSSEQLFDVILAFDGFRITVPSERASESGRLQKYLEGVEYT